MKIDSLERVRQRLDRHVRLVNKSSLSSLNTILKCFFLFLENDPILRDILRELSAEIRYVDLYRQFKISNTGLSLSTEAELAGIAYVSLQEIARSNDHPRPVVGQIYSNNVNDMETQPQSARDQRMLEFYLNLFLTPLHLYLDERLNERRAMTTILIRYKHLCEWFNREELLQQYRADTTRGEKNMSLHLYNFLFHEGVRFTIEPSSLDGKIDLIAAQGSNDPLLADAKVFSGDNSYICKAFGQIYRYCCKYNEPEGYLVIFNTTEKDIVFPGEASPIIPSVKYNNKTIHLLSVDICDHSKSPSQRGAIKNVVFTEDDFFSAAQDAVEESN